MSGDLNAGQGRCNATSRVLIKPVRAAIELGALPDVIMTALHAVHEANRTGAANDFVAVTFPGMVLSERGMLRALKGMATGDSIELVGSEAALVRCLNMDRMKTLQRRGMIIEPDVTEVWMEAGDLCAAYVRERPSEKETTGWINRSRRRAERRGKPIGDPALRSRDKTGVVVLRYGDAVVKVREVVGELVDRPLTVSTYGFSTAGNPAIMPVQPVSVRQLLLDAA